MAYKIHKRGAFVIIENTVNGEIKELNSQYVQITKGKTSLDQYEVLYNGVSQLKAVLGDIQDANGVVYVEADWDVFRYEQCGSVNSSEVANPYPAHTTVEVNITTAEIINGVDPIELLPAPDANQYYSGSVRLEYTAGNSLIVCTTCAVGFFTPSPTNYMLQGVVLTEFITVGGTDNAVEFSFNESVKSTTFNNQIRANGIMGKPLLLTFGINGANMGFDMGNAYEYEPGANGTLRAIITYTTRTFGA